MAKEIELSIPGKATRLSWTPPKDLSFEDWEEAITRVAEVGAAAAWLVGDMWRWGSAKYGDRVEKLRQGKFGEYTYGTLRNYGWVCGAVGLSYRYDSLTFLHHQHVAPFPPAQQKKWLDRAVEGEDGKPWSSGKLKAQIAQAAAVAKTIQIELDAKALGKYAVLYADPPWRYEHPPMGDTGRSIENHYPTMTIEEICALPVGDIAHKDSILFMWATSPKLAESMKVLEAWGFDYRTNMVWVKDKIGMGYYCREQHELLLIARRGDLAPPAPGNRISSVIYSARGGHSEKPTELYGIIDAMYQGDKIRKIELFGRLSIERPAHWAVWGNDVAVAA